MWEIFFISNNKWIKGDTSGVSQSIYQSLETTQNNKQPDVSWIKHRHFSAYEHNNICEERQQLRVENKDKQLGTSGGT